MNLWHRMVKEAGLTSRVSDTNSQLNEARALYEEGAFDVEVAKFLNITIKRFNELYDESSAFAKFVDMGRTMSMAYWYELGRRGASGRLKGFVPGAWSFVMKNQFGWADKVESTQQLLDETTNIDDLKSKLRRGMKDLAKTSPEMLDAIKGIVENG